MPLVWIRPQQQPGRHQARYRTDYCHLRLPTPKLSSPVMVKALLLLPQVRKASVNLAHALHRVLIRIAAKEENKEAEVILYQTYTYCPLYLSHSLIEVGFLKKQV